MERHYDRIPRVGLEDDALRQADVHDVDRPLLRDRDRTVAQERALLFDRHLYLGERVVVQGRAHAEALDDDGFVALQLHDAAIPGVHVRLAKHREAFQYRRLRLLSGRDGEEQGVTVAVLVARQILEHGTLLLGRQDAGAGDDPGEVLERHAREVNQVDSVSEDPTLVARARVLVLPLALALRPAETHEEQLELRDRETLELEDAREQTQRDVAEAGRVKHVLGACLDERRALLYERRLVVEQTLLVDETNVVRVEVFLQVLRALGRQRRHDVLLTDVEDRQHKVVAEVDLVTVHVAERKHIKIQK